LPPLLGLVEVYLKNCTKMVEGGSSVKAQDRLEIPKWVKL